MDLYIDFDNTLYDTTKLRKVMLEKIAKQCCLYAQSNYETILFELESTFCREKIYNIYELCDYFGKKYNIIAKKLYEVIDNILENGNEFLYNDAENFLKKSKNEHRLFLLTYTSDDNLVYQKKKVNGCDIAKYFHKIIYTTANKYTLDIDYKNSIFIDDNPKELIGLAETEAYRIIRIKRTDCKYSKIQINSPKIIEFENLNFYNGNIKFEKRA